MEKKWKIKWTLGLSKGFLGIVVSKNLGCLFGGPHNKDYSILGSTLGSPYFGKLPKGLFWRSLSVARPD